MKNEEINEKCELIMNRRKDISTGQKSGIGGTSLRMTKE
jgi:hypothetical protein